MSEQPYTPSTVEVRNAYRLSDQDIDGSPYLPEKSDVEFDKWLAQVKADAWDEAVDAAGNHIFSGHPGDLPNPYRREADR